MLIRRAEQKDAKALVIILAQMGANYIRTVEEIANRIESFHNSDDQLFVAEIDQEIVGLIAFGFYTQFRLQGCCCHIDTLVIDQNFRGRGIGRSLLQTAEAYALKMGATEIETTSANHRIADGTHDFYKGLGYKTHIEIDCAYFAKSMN